MRAASVDELFLVRPIDVGGWFEGALAHEREDLIALVDGSLDGEMEGLGEIHVVAAGDRGVLRGLGLGFGPGRWLPRTTGSPQRDALLVGPSRIW